MNTERKTPTLTKGYAGQLVTVDEAERSIVHRINTDEIDRDGEVVPPGGLDLKFYRSNPVVVWAHDYSKEPFAKNLWIKPEGDTGLIAKTQFADTRDGRRKFYLYKEGYLSGWSVGFLPDKSSIGPPTQKEISAKPHWKSARRIVRIAELVEYSGTPIPTCRGALTRALVAKAFGLPEDSIEDLEITVPETGEVVGKAVEVPEVPEVPATPALLPDAPARHIQPARVSPRRLAKALAEIDPGQLAKTLDIPGIVRDTIDRLKGRV